MDLESQLDSETGKRVDTIFVFRALELSGDLEHEKKALWLILAFIHIRPFVE